ncbi:MAG: lysostaphin resistance A-like protein [Terriglobales bacterium]
MSSPDQPVPIPEPSLEATATGLDVTAPAPALVRDPLWSGFDILLILGVGLVGLISAIIGLGVLVGMVAAVQKRPADPDLVATGLAAQSLCYLLVVAFMRFLVEYRYRARFWEAVKWQWPQGGAWLGFLVGGVALAIGVQLASAWLPIPKSLPIQELLKEPANAWLLAAFGILVAPFVEEMFFRGFLYPVLARFLLGLLHPALGRQLATGTAVLLTALAFTAIHGPQLAHHWAPLLLLFSVSLVFTVARALTGSVSVSFLMHVGYNTTLFAVLFLATDGFRHMEKALQ